GLSDAFNAASASLAVVTVGGRLRLSRARCGDRHRAALSLVYAPDYPSRFLGRRALPAILSRLDAAHCLLGDLRPFALSAAAVTAQSRRRLAVSARTRAVWRAVRRRRAGARHSCVARRTFSHDGRREPELGGATGLPFAHLSGAARIPVAVDKRSHGCAEPCALSSDDARFRVFELCRHRYLLVAAGRAALVGESLRHGAADHGACRRHAYE